MPQTLTRVEGSTFSRLMDGLVADAVVRRGVDRVDNFQQGAVLVGLETKHGGGQEQRSDAIDDAEDVSVPERYRARLVLI